MAEYTMTSPKPGVRKIKWGPLTTTDRAGNFLSLPDYPEKTVRVFGTFGASASVSIKTPAHDTGTTRLPVAGDIDLNDGRGEENPIALTAANSVVVNENPDKLGPYLADGDGSTSVTVVMTCVQ